MATSSTYYIDSSSFNTATSVYLDLSLSNKAPDGFYSFEGIYRQQLYGLLQDVVSCTGTPIVNCVVSDWSAWSPCSGGNETRTRTVITPASGGGTACPVLTETRPCSVSCTTYSYIADRDGIITWTDCDGTPRSRSVSRFGSETICAITGSHSTGYGQWFNQGPC